MLRFETTQRGFAVVHFTDHYGESCSLQASSLASEAAIWMGVKGRVQHCVQGQGWFPLPLPEGAHIVDRMHLTRDQVAQLIPVLQRFVDTGEVSDG